MENPNSYDDEQYALAVDDLQDVIANLWHAGADFENLRDELSNALENATGARCTVQVSDG